MSKRAYIVAVMRPKVKDEGYTLEEAREIAEEAWERRLHQNDT